MKNTFSNTTFLFLFFICFSSFGQLTGEQMIDSTKNGNTIADFNLISTSGDTVNFYSFKEDLIIIDIWATWCGPCKAQAPSFDSLRAIYTSEKIRFISVSIDKPADLKKWESYLKKKVKEGSKKDHFLAGSDSNHPIHFFTRNLYYENDVLVGILEGIPQYIIIGKNHKIEERNAPQPQTGELEKMILELKKEYQF